MCQEDKDMADQNEAKTKTIGFLPKEKVQTLKGWDEYIDKSTKLSVLRTEAQKAKNSVRDPLKRRTKSLDLSSSFREELVEDPSEATGKSGDEPTSNLDPVTERLMAIMREKRAASG